MVAIEVTETVEVARVEVGDDYRVHLWQARKLSSYTPTQALQLSQELAEAALEARRVAEEREEAEGARIRQTAGGVFDGTLTSVGVQSLMGGPVVVRPRFFPDGE